MTRPIVSDVPKSEPCCGQSPPRWIPAFWGILAVFTGNRFQCAVSSGRAGL